MWFFSSRKARRTTTKPSSRPTFRPCVRSLEDRCLMSAGMLDPTFNPAGIPPGVAVAPLVGSNDYGNVCLVQPSGKVVVAGRDLSSKGSSYTMLAEFDSNGSLDPTFGSGGIVTTSTAGAPAWAATGLLYPTASGDEKILVVGPGSNTLALVRYNANGSLDSSFGHNGIVDTSFNKQAVSVLDGVTLVPNGTSPKIVAACNISNNVVELARYNSDGSLDTNFGTKGTASISVPGGTNFSRLARDPINGDLIVSWQNGELAAFTSAGALDTSFATSGVLNSGIANQFGLTVDSAGRILVGGNGAVARYSLSGTLDTNWGGTGIVAVGGWSLAIQPDGKVVTYGDSRGVARLNGDGSLDASFGTNGFAGSGGILGNVGEPPTIAVAPNGDIVVGNSAQDHDKGGLTTVFAAARLLPSEPEIGSFTANQVMAGGPVTLTASNISDGNPNSSISQVTFFYYDSSGNKIIAGTATSPDGSGNWTVNANLPPGSYTLYAQATDSYGVLGDPLAYSLTVQ